MIGNIEITSGIILYQFLNIWFENLGINQETDSPSSSK